MKPTRPTPTPHLFRSLVLLGAVAVLLLAGCRHDASGEQENAAATEVFAWFEEGFKGEGLDAQTWVVTSHNDFLESAVDVVEGRLRLRAATVGTAPATVKYLGVRTAQPLDLHDSFDLSFGFDWNDQSNGCYLTAGLYLCPTATDTTPVDEKDWLRFQYIGVPPGKNARAWVSERVGGGERVLYDEGWPENRSGRDIGRQDVRLSWQDGVLSVHEDGQLLWSGDWQGFAENSAYLYLQLSSHSNYPAREIFFDNVVFNPQGAGEQ